MIQLRIEPGQGISVKGMPVLRRLKRRKYVNVECLTGNEPVIRITETTAVGGQIDCVTAGALKIFWSLPVDPKEQDDVLWGVPEGNSFEADGTTFAMPENTLMLSRKDCDPQKLRLSMEKLLLAIEDYLRYG
ncbi:hypothetical protein [Dictyobacter formicarum]|uniref:Uncharacterized protein n=1 Tax=Dictyobacter formicarum TaxID=2778368 RepID=A0ABQ3VGY1_9CHLR|nr:hypothetical protein [Dictyobacter formicarum]GHO85192.1 hypothetical protein KSZ_31980 [Dictyobacter formicarum]